MEPSFKEAGVRTVLACHHLGGETAVCGRVRQVMCKSKLYVSITFYDRGTKVLVTVDYQEVSLASEVLQSQLVVGEEVRFCTATRLIEEA